MHYVSNHDSRVGQGQTSPKPSKARLGQERTIVRPVVRGTKKTKRK